MITYSFPSVPLYDLLLEKVAERRVASGYEIVPIDQEPVDWLLENDPWGRNFVVGAHTLTDVTNKIKYVQEFPVSVGEVAYEYLQLVAKDYSCGSRGHKAFPPPPMYYNGARRGLMSYVDITSCYFSIYSSATLDCFYASEGLYRDGDFPFLFADQLRFHKLTRNSVFGIIRKEGRTRYYNGEYKRTNEAGNYFSPGLIRYVLETTQAVAQDAVKKFEIHAWLTDAAILPASQAESFRDYLFSEWNFDSSEKASGAGYLYRPTLYRIGDFWGGDQRLISSMVINRESNFENVNIDFLKKARRSLVNV